MSAVGIRLVGGPADGHELTIPGDPWDPPQTYEVLHFSLQEGKRRLVYGRELNRGNDGPLWFYCYLEGSAEEWPG